MVRCEAQADSEARELALRSVNWYWPSEMAARVPKTAGLVKQDVTTPSACVDAYGERMVFIHSSTGARSRPFSIHEQLAFERALVACCDHLGIPRWSHRSTSAPVASSELTTLSTAARAVTQGGLWLGTEAAVLTFVGDVVRNKLLTAYSKYELASSLAAASLDVVVLGEVRGRLSDAVDGVCSDSSSSVGGPLALRIHRKLGKGHFVKDAHSRMSVPLAVQVLSDRMRALIDDMLSRNGTPSLRREYTGMRELVVRMNRLVDICNCRGDRVDPPAPAINSRNHSLLGELASTMSFFTKWRIAIDRCPDFKTAQERECAKLSIETHTGLQRLILGHICSCLCFLPELHPASTHIMSYNARRAMSDPCENEFSCNRYACTGGHPTMQAAMRNTVARSASRLAARALEHNSARARVDAQLPAFEHAGATSSYAAPEHGE